MGDRVVSDSVAVAGPQALLLLSGEEINELHLLHRARAGLSHQGVKVPVVPRRRPLPEADVKAVAAREQRRLAEHPLPLLLLLSKRRVEKVAAGVKTL